MTRFEWGSCERPEKPEKPTATEEVINRLQKEAKTADDSRTRYTAADSQTINNVADTIKSVSECKPENLRQVLAECLQKQLNDPRHPFSPGQLRAFVNLLNKECQNLGNDNPLKGLKIHVRGMMAVIEDPAAKAKTTVGTHSITEEVNGKLVVGDKDPKAAKKAEETSTDTQKSAKQENAGTKVGEAVKHEAIHVVDAPDAAETNAKEGKEAKASNEAKETKETKETKTSAEEGKSTDKLPQEAPVKTSTGATETVVKQDNTSEAPKPESNEKQNVVALTEVEKAEQAKQLGLAQAFLDKYYRDITAPNVETREKLPVAQAELNQAEKQFKAAFEKFPPAVGSPEEQAMKDKLQELKNQQEYMKSLHEAEKQIPRPPVAAQPLPNMEAGGDRFNDVRYKQMTQAEQRGDIYMMSNPASAAGEYQRAGELYTAYMRAHLAQMNQQERDAHNHHYRNLMDKYRQAEMMSQQQQMMPLMTPGMPPMVPPVVPPVRMDVGPGVIEIPNPLELFQQF